MTPPEPRPSIHDGWTPEPQEEVQPGDPWRTPPEPRPLDGQTPLTSEAEAGIRSGWWRDKANRGWLAIGYVDRLLATLDATRDEYDGYRDAHNGWCATPAAEAGAEPGLREALRPFAEFADPFADVPPSYVITQGSSMARRQLTMGDCYKARAALDPRS